MTDSAPSKRALVGPPTITNHCHDNVLIIPDGLRGFAEARSLLQWEEAAIFHKKIARPMRGIEFFTNAPCLAYVVKGFETFTTAGGTELVVRAGDMLLMPRHHYMLSDFENADGPLEAFLFFFNGPVIDEFLKATSPHVATQASDGPAHFRGAASLSAYIEALPKVYSNALNTPALVKTKLLEVLLLLQAHDTDKQLHAFLIKENTSRGRRNIRHIMRDHANSKLKVADYAQLSGRSLSSFQRHFRQEFGQTPHNWLKEKRLDTAHKMITSGDAPISEIAFQTGYADTSHFIKAFKARFGATPKQVRLEFKG